MTRFLLDTTFIIDVLNNQRNRYKVMRDLIADQHELACCAVNVTEIYTGMRAPESAKTEALLRGLLYIPIGFEAAKLAGELRQAWARKGKGFSVPDMIIAAVCLTEGLTLITDNRKDFPMPDLSIHTLPA
jgi:predicted nucleic acid-binding protein